MSILYVAGIDIGNRLDNTFRLKEEIIKSDFILVESFKEGSKLLKYFEVKKEMFELNEHTKENELPEIIKKIKDANSVVLVSDCGTALLEDPGRALIESCYSSKIKVKTIPGASSITSAIMLTPFSMREFYYAGLLPRSSKEREDKLFKLKKFNIPIIILDTPYRLTNVLQAAVKIFGKDRNAILALDISTDDEETCVDMLSNIEKNYRDVKKREFVLIIDSR